MTLPKVELFPEDPDQLPPARRRRARRLLAPLDADERAAFLDDLAHRASPSFDFFLFSLVGGLVFGLGLVLDAPAILVLGALLCPLMAPAIGVSLGIVIGSPSYFLRSLAGLVIGSLLVLIAGIVAGFLAGFIQHLWGPLALIQTYIHAQFSWSNFLLLALGSGFTVATIVHSDRTPAIPSIALAYTLYLPLTIAGMGLSSGFPHLWPDGLVVFAVYLAWSALIGAGVFALLGYRPLTLLGYTLSGVVALIGVILVIGIGGAGAAFGGRMGLPTLVPSATLTITPTRTETPTPIPPTLTPTITLTPSLSPTVTKTPPPTPTPVYVLISAADSTGAVLRSEPGGAVLESYVNGTLLQLLPETETVEGVVWVQVVAPDKKKGWMMQPLVATVTPAP